MKIKEVFSKTKTFAVNCFNDLKNWFNERQKSELILIVVVFTAWGLSIKSCSKYTSVVKENTKAVKEEIQILKSLNVNK